MQNRRIVMFFLYGFLFLVALVAVYAAVAGADHGGGPLRAVACALVSLVFSLLAVLVGVELELETFWGVACVVLPALVAALSGAVLVTTLISPFRAKR